MTRVGIIGGTGYTGMELIRLLLNHPAADIVAVCSRSQAGKDASEVFPHLAGFLDLTVSESLDVDCDVIFFAAPNGVAMQTTAELLDKGVRVIDLAADFRLRDADVWEQWYKMPHHCPERLEQAVYGLTEIYRDEVKQTNLVANPGCYPTAVLLGFYPLIKNGAVKASAPLIADVKSGVSGAGRRADLGLTLPEVANNFKAYKATAHRHFPEIKQELERFAGQSAALSFTPHLLPISRGIIATLYCQTALAQTELQNLFEQTYKDERFVKVLPQSAHPEVRYVAGTNECHVAVHKPADSDVAKVLVALDNLVKGAAGQALQNMNLMIGAPEAQGLENIALVP